VDIVHLHGATNAYVAKHLREHIDREDMGPKPPTIVYTMHDYLDELQYTNTIQNVRKFIGNRDIDDAMSEMQNYMHGHRMFMSSLAIDSADVVTIVSKSMAKEIVEGRLDFYLKELVMDSLLRKAQKHHFFGVSNGVDFATLNPFTSKKLTTRKCSFHCRMNPTTLLLPPKTEQSGSWFAVIYLKMRTSSDLWFSSLVVSNITKAWSSLKLPLNIL
jgi:glycogen synthase